MISTTLGNSIGESVADQYDQIPGELKSLERWVPFAVGADGKKRPAGNYSSTDPDTWLTFDECIKLCRENGWYPAFALSADAPYILIDLDKPKEGHENPEKVLADHEFIKEVFANTYQETSVSGNGTHILVLGEIVRARKKGEACVEIYTDRRFMICTGKHNGKPIIEQQEALDDLWEKIGGSKNSAPISTPMETLSLPKETVDEVQGHYLKREPSNSTDLFLYGVKTGDDHSEKRWGVMKDIGKAYIDLTEKRSEKEFPQGQGSAVVWEIYRGCPLFDPVVHGLGKKGHQPKKYEECQKKECEKAFAEVLANHNSQVEFSTLLRNEKSRGRKKPKELTSVEQFEAALAITDKEIETLRSAEFLIPNFIIRGHLIAIHAPANGGKTTIATSFIAPQLVERGMVVYYITTDIAGTDITEEKAKADQRGYKLMEPDLMGVSMEKVVEMLEGLSESEDDLGDKVFFIDTIKKIAEVISKQDMKRVLTILRKLTKKGATVITLGHTNKYKDADGKHIHEGTGDQRSDVDELFYLDAQTQGDIMTVQVVKDKVRGQFSREPLFLEFDVNEREACVIGKDCGVATMEMGRREYAHRADAAEIGTIEDCLREAKKNGVGEESRVNQSALIELLKNEHGTSHRQALKILNELERNESNPHGRWVSHRGAKNAKLYEWPFPL